MKNQPLQEAIFHIFSIKNVLIDIELISILISR